MYYGTLIVRFLAKPWEYTLFTSILGLSFQRVEEFRTNEMLLWLDERTLIKGSTDHSCFHGRSKPASYGGGGERLGHAAPKLNGVLTIKK